MRQRPSKSYPNNNTNEEFLNERENTDEEKDLSCSLNTTGDEFNNETNVRLENQFSDDEGGERGEEETEKIDNENESPVEQVEGDDDDINDDDDDEEHRENEEETKLDLGDDEDDEEKKMQSIFDENSYNSDKTKEEEEEEEEENDIDQQNAIDPNDDITTITKSVSLNDQSPPMVKVSQRKKQKLVNNS